MGIKQPKGKGPKGKQRQRKGRRYCSNFFQRNRAYKLSLKGDSRGFRRRRRFVDFRNFNTPWWFSHMEDLHMTRQYWKQNSAHLRRKGFGKFMRKKEFLKVWLEHQGLLFWQKD